MHAQLKEQFIFCARRIFIQIIPPPPPHWHGRHSGINTCYFSKNTGALARRCFMACKFLAENPFIGHFSCIPLHAALAALVFASSSLSTFEWLSAFLAVNANLRACFVIWLKAYFLEYYALDHWIRWSGVPIFVYEILGRCESVLSNSPIIL